MKKHTKYTIAAVVVWTLSIAIGAVIGHYEGAAAATRIKAREAAVPSVVRTPTDAELLNDDLVVVLEGDDSEAEKLKRFVDVADDETLSERERGYGAQFIRNLIETEMTAEQIEVVRRLCDSPVQEVRDEALRTAALKGDADHAKQLIADNIFTDKFSLLEMLRVSTRLEEIPPQLVGLAFNNGSNADKMVAVLSLSLDAQGGDFDDNVRIAYAGTDDRNLRRVAAAYLERLPGGFDLEIKDCATCP